ncbi:pathogenesis-related leaf protein 6 isoform X4, partial [Biomphalaria glabrata]
LLWRNSTKLGCAIKSDCLNMLNYAVCIYDQPCVKSTAGEHVHKTRLMVLGSVLFLS